MENISESKIECEPGGDVSYGHVADAVDLMVFAGQSNMSGRGSADDAAVCGSSAGFEYKAVSNPYNLVPIEEPFGLNEDRRGGLCDIDLNGMTKRRGSMVSALVDTYYKKTGRKVVGVSASMGGTNTEEWKNNLVSDAASRLDAAKEFLARTGINTERIFVVWCQGESDGDAKRSKRDYTENLRYIFDVFKAHGAEHIFMIQTGHYNYVKYPEPNKGLTGEEWDACYGVIRDAQAAMCGSCDDVTMVGSLEPYISDMKDHYHYNQSAYNAVGAEAGAKIAEYCK